MAAKNDFVTFYAGAKLAGTPDLYSRGANLAMNKALVGSTMDMMYIRPPFYAALLKPLSLFPYLIAYAIFSAASLASILWFVIRFSKECPALPFASFSLPFLATLSAGQDSPFLLPVLGGAILLTRKRPGSRGGARVVPLRDQISPLLASAASVRLLKSGGAL